MTITSATSGDRQPSVDPRWIIRVEDVHKSFDGKVVLDGVDFQVERGKTTVIVGRSGAGKTVLMKHLIGLLRPDRGRVLVEGDDISAMNDVERTRAARKFGMVFQHSALLDSMTVADNIG